MDRFLSILLDEVALAAGGDEADLGAIARTRNTPRKLDLVGERYGAPIEGAARLRALGRCRDTLFHCGGVVRRGDDRRVSSLTLGWPSDREDGPAATLLDGERLVVSPSDLAWIGAFYEGLGGSLSRLPAVPAAL